MAAIFDDHTFGYWRCDLCGRTLSSVAGVTPILPRPWEAIEIEGFVGDFHICRPQCKTDLINRVGPARATDDDGEG